MVKIEACPQNGMILSLSADSCVLWNTVVAPTMKKERSLFAQQGCLFADARFSPDGNQVGTLFKDGNLVLWDIDAI